MLCSFEHKAKVCYKSLNTIPIISNALNIPSFYITNADKLPENSLAERLEKARLLRCQNIKTACREIGIAEKSYYNLMRGKNISKETLSKITAYIQKHLKF